MKRKRLLTLLVLLLTAATGAWAGWTGGTYTATTNETLSAINVGSSATLTINSNVTVTVNGGITINSGATLTVKGPGTLVVTGAKGNNGNGGIGVIVGGTGGTGGVAISGNIIVQGGAVVTATGGTGGNGGTGDKGGRGGNGGNAFAGTLTYKDGTVTANGGSGGSGGWGELELESGSSGSAGKAFADANSVSFQTDYILTSNGSAIQTIGGQQQITIAPPPVAVTGVTLPATATVTLGNAVALTAAVAPADATDKKVKWTVTAGTDKVKLYKDADCKTEVGTEATDVLTVYAKGLAVGDATVKVESNADATKTATCAVTAKHGTYAVAMKAGVTDGDQWTAKAGQDGQYQAMPLKGVEGGTKPVELKYAGDREVKRVTMRVVPACDLSMVDCAGTARTDGQWTANCYMVHTAGDYKLPLVYGNAIKAGQTNDAAYTGVENANTTLTFPRHDGNAITAPWIKDNGITVASAELLWQDADGLITEVGISGDYLTLTVDKDAATQEGNALVAAKDADGNIVWSWHIWVTKQTFAAADLTTVDTGEGGHVYTVTPVNLGWVGDDIYTGTNTFYQWGRKDPFKGTGTVTFDGTTAATIADNIKNPATFYNVSGKPSNTTYYNMWDAQQTAGTNNITTATVKTVYDPSPAGFCVPTGNLYYYMKYGSGVSFGWDGENMGRNLTSVTPNVFFPASGYRYNGDGSLSNVGSYGSCWSASAYGIDNNYARNLDFTSNNRYWSFYFRSSGFSVRAVAE